jgi:single-stranded-DNA-specific exonuclease
MEKLWVIRRRDEKQVGSLERNLSSLQRQILWGRGLQTSSDIDHFFAVEEGDGHDPFLLSGMEKAVSIIIDAIRDEKKIVIYGDYDADGVSATAMLVSGLKRVGAVVDRYLPDRFSEGYGLNSSAIEQISRGGASLLITVDCGIRGCQEVALAVERGMQVVVTDHHLPGVVLPGAHAIINPKLQDDPYPYKELAGVGVAYKLLSAMFLSLNNRFQDEYLDLVAIGTVADLVPLAGENRSLVQRGLRSINLQPRTGIRALIDQSGHRLGQIDSMAIGFGLAPRINAAGRIASAEIAYRLLTSNDEAEALSLAESLEKLNTTRRRLTMETVEHVRDTIGVEDPPILIFTADSAYHPGVVGLAASRLTEEFYRPAIVGSLGEMHTRASARSIPEFNVTEALDSVSDLLLRYGGHAAAAGFTVGNDHSDQLRERLLSLAEEQIGGARLIPTLDIEGVVGFDELDWELLEFLDKMEPFGAENPSPVFAAEKVRIREMKQVGKEKSHLKLMFEAQNKLFDAIAFRQGNKANKLSGVADVAFRLERNEYLGYQNLQLNVVDLRPTGSFNDPELTAFVDDPISQQNGI